MNQVEDIIVWELDPTVRVGHFKLGDDIEKYVTRFNLTCEKLDEDESQVYNIGNTNSFLSVFDGKIGYVDCADSLIYKGKELIGIEYIELIQILGTGPDEIDEVAVQYEDGYEEYSVTFNNLDLIVWIDNSTKKVQSIACGEGDDC